MIGQSEAFRSVRRLVSLMADFDAPVLIEGETGTGKELVARAIHYDSARASGPFVPVNCGGMPDALIENELFGHRRGAFTDARDDQPGLVALARYGTLFLDEVDALSERGQVALLRFLQDQHFRPLGSRQEERADVRLIAASNQDLAAKVAAGAFRQDLMYRLRVLELCVPPLRARRDDLTLLAQHFVDCASRRFGKPSKTIHPDTLAWFARYDWPGNVRELEHLVYRAFLLGQGDEISIPAPESLGRHDATACPPSLPRNYLLAKKQAISDFENRFLKNLIAETHGNISAAARLAGTERRHLGRLLRKHQLTKHANSGS